MSDQWMQAGPDDAQPVPVPPDQVFAIDDPWGPIPPAPPLTQQQLTSAAFLREHLSNAPVWAAEAPWTLPDQALRFQRPSDIEKVIAGSGNRYFDPRTMERYGMRLESGLYADRFFIVSHAAESGRIYTVNWASRAPGDTHIAVERFDDTLTTPHQAHALAQRAFASVELNDSPALDAVPRPVRKFGNDLMEGHSRQQVGPVGRQLPIR